jgi:hypothetical protein
MERREPEFKGTFSSQSLEGSSLMCSEFQALFDFEQLNCRYNTTQIEAGSQVMDTKEDGRCAENCTKNYLWCDMYSRSSWKEKGRSGEEQGDLENKLRTLRDLVFYW